MVHKDSLSVSKLNSIIESIFLSTRSVRVFQSLDGSVLTLTIPSCYVGCYSVEKIMELTDTFFNFNILGYDLVIEFRFRSIK